MKTAYSRNKKIRNAAPTNYDGVALKSSLERTIYKALKEQNIDFQYEGVTYVLSKKVTPKKPFYISSKSKKLHLDMAPLRAITYTPDFSFTINGVLVILEVKGYCNDVYPVKRNLFRKFLETFSTPVIFFEIKSKRELMEALDIVKKEGKLIETIREYVQLLPVKDLSPCKKAIDERNYQLLYEIVKTRIEKMEKNLKKDATVCIPDGLYKLYGILTDLTNEEIIGN